MSQCILTFCMWQTWCVLRAGKSTFINALTGAQLLPVNKSASLSRLRHLCILASSHHRHLPPYICSSSQRLCREVNISMPCTNTFLQHPGDRAHMSHHAHAAARWRGAGAVRQQQGHAGGNHRRRGGHPPPPHPPQSRGMSASATCSFCHMLMHPSCRPASAATDLKWLIPLMVSSCFCCGRCSCAIRPRTSACAGAHAGPPAERRGATGHPDAHYRAVRPGTRRAAQRRLPAARHARPQRVGCDPLCSAACEARLCKVTS